jgi:ABC-type lipoprotein export system ATPase subunit
MFALNNVRHLYDGSAVLAVDRWEVAQGEHWLLVGPSGSGKTTLLHILAGILRPTEGRVSVAGQELAALSAHALDLFRGRHVGIVLQKLHLVGSLTVMRNLLLAQYLAGLPQDRARVREVLDSLDMADKADTWPHALSHGQAQRIALARAVVNRPQLLIADEPTSNLDDMRALQALDFCEEQARACNATLVIATHDQRIRDRVSRQRVLGGAA